MSTAPARDGFGRGDTKLPCGGSARLPDDDVNVTPERGKQADQILRGILAEVATQEPQHVGFGQTDSTGLGKPSPAQIADSDRTGKN